MQLKMLSVNLARQDILDIMSSKHYIDSGWWLVFEDDIALARPASEVREAVLLLLQFAVDDGIASFVMCSPNSCTDIKTVNSVEFAKCLGYCAHAMAYMSDKAQDWREELDRIVPGTEHEPIHTQYAPDISMNHATKSKGGMWVAGLNVHSPITDQHVGVLYQARNRFKSEIGD